MNDHAELIKRLRDAAFQAEDDKTGKDTPESKLLRDAIAALEAGRSSGDPWPTIRARLELAIEHGDAHGWYTARNELLGVIGSDYAAAPQQPTGRSADWVLVPREMTPAMWKAWEQSHMVSESYQEDYAAMLAATPQQPTPVGVTDAMVERAYDAFITTRGTYEGEVPICQDEIRAAIVAALSHQQPAPQQPTGRNGKAVVEDDDGMPVGYADWYNRQFAGATVDTRRDHACEAAWRAALKAAPQQPTGRSGEALQPSAEMSARVSRAWAIRQAHPEHDAAQAMDHDGMLEFHAGWYAALEYAAEVTQTGIAMTKLALMSDDPAEARAALDRMCDEIDAVLDAASVSEPAYTKADDLLHTIGSVEHPDATSGESREDRMVVVERDEAGKVTVWCDPEIVDLVSALNAGGVRTIASCSGHGHRPGWIALLDGRHLTISPDEATHKRIEALFPVDINGDHIDDRRAASGEGWDALRNELTAMATKTDVQVRLSRVNSIIEKARRLTTTGQGEPDGWNIRRRDGGLLVRGPGGMTTFVNGSLEAGGMTGIVLHALAKDLLASKAQITTGQG